jgi:hypothetical protein
MGEADEKRRDKVGQPLLVTAQVAASRLAAPMPANAARQPRLLLLTFSVATGHSASLADRLRGSWPFVLFRGVLRRLGEPTRGHCAQSALALSSRKRSAQQGLAERAREDP